MPNFAWIYQDIVPEKTNILENVIQRVKDRKIIIRRNFSQSFYNNYHILADMVIAVICLFCFHVDFMSNMDNQKSLSPAITVLQQWTKLKMGWMSILCSYMMNLSFVPKSTHHEVNIQDILRENSHEGTFQPYREG